MQCDAAVCTSPTLKENSSTLYMNLQQQARLDDKALVAKVQVSEATVGAAGAAS